MNRIARLVAAGLLLSSPVAAQTLQAPAQLYNEGDLKLESGEAIKDFSISCMDAFIAIVPLAKTPAWGAAVVEASRKAIMEDPAWKDGNYDAPPEKGVRLWRDIVNLLAARTPEMYSAQFKNPIDVLPWLTEQENAMIKAFDANDWIYQGWAYERHDLGGTPGFNGDTAKALASIKANVDPHGDQGSAQSGLRAKGGG
jgi:hypothetical protein